MKSIFWSGLSAMALAGMLVPGTALANKVPPQPMPVLLTVEDNAKVFSESAIQKARDLVHQVKSTFNEQVHIETSSSLTASEQEKQKNDEKAFWKEWVHEKIVGERTGHRHQYESSPNRGTGRSTDQVERFR